MATTTQLIPHVTLGTQGFQVSKLGFGCMGLSGAYNDPLPEQDGISVIHYAFTQGITFFDTADLYGVDGSNEILVGKALKQLPREKIQLATKFGISRGDAPGFTGVSIKGSPEYVRSCCEASLKRLGVGYIDLYYQHRVDTSVPIEDTVGELKKLVEEGKVKELGIGIVPYSPLGRGFFGGKGVLENVSAVSNLTSYPRFQAENLEKNKSIYDRIESLGNKHGCTPAQLALAWVLHQGQDVVPIPGTTKIKNLDQNLGALSLKLSEEDVKEISAAVPVDDVAGSRYYNGSDQLSWKFANTPPKV
ncbi:hypothetical protein RYX36_032724 [Vicia faba]